MYQLEGTSGPGVWFILQSAGNMNSVLEDSKGDFYPNGGILALILDIIGIALALVLPVALVIGLLP